MDSQKALYDELTLYTLAHNDPSFIHQHGVDAYAAQHADESSKPIKVFFALVGLYLHLERGMTGRQVQQEHVRLGEAKKTWQKLKAPQQRGSVTVINVLAALPGKERDAMIHQWCASVWEAWKNNDPHLVRLIVNGVELQTNL